MSLTCEDLMVMMKLSLLLLLTLTSNSLQDIVKSSHLETVSSLNPNLKDRVPETTANRSTLIYQHLLSPPKLRQKRQIQAPLPMFDNGKLKWQPWAGSVPNGVVSIYNTYVGKLTYICKHRCNAGYYNPDLGPFCYYPYGNKEYNVSSFEFLVNEDNFEILEWKDGSFGSVPRYSIRTCSSDEIYVGKNKYGLGKVHPKHSAFFLPWKGSEYWYKKYKVLTIKKDVKSEHISNVKYNTNGADIFQYPPETMSISAITNNNCNPVMKTVTFSRTNQMQRRWDIGISIMIGGKKTITAGVPCVVSGNIEINTELTFQFSGGNTVTEESSHSTSVELTVPPNHRCKARMVGYKYKANIPFTALYNRTYNSGETSWTTITGTYSNIQIGEVEAVVDRCEPIADAKPCPQRASQDN